MVVKGSDEDSDDDEGGGGSRELWDDPDNLQNLVWHQQPSSSVLRLSR